MAERGPEVAHPASETPSYGGRMVLAHDLGGFSIDRDNFDGTVRLVLTGELDLAHVGRLNDEVDRCPEDKTVQVDTTELAFIDSTGLGAIVAARKRLGPERFELIPGEAVRRILELRGTDDYLLD